nr:reverse transcriptase domain-containing protein [Tanacetum cinerariifolium]
MSTRSYARSLFPPLDNLKLTIQRRSRYDQSLLNNSDMAAEGPGDLPVPDLRTMEELCQASLNGRGGPIALIAIHATNFGLKNDISLFPPLDNLKLTIQRRSRYDQSLLNNSDMAAEGLGDLPVPDLRTMEELCQPSLNGRGGPIALIAIHATNFGLNNDMFQQV